MKVEKQQGPDKRLLPNRYLQHIVELLRKEVKTLGVKVDALTAEIKNITEQELNDEHIHE